MALLFVGCVYAMVRLSRGILKSMSIEAELTPVIVVSVTVLICFFARAVIYILAIDFFSTGDRAYMNVSFILTDILPLSLLMYLYSKRTNHAAPPPSPDDGRDLFPVSDP